MPTIRFIQPAGGTIDCAGDVGQSAMEVAKRAGVDGIIGECGGSLACATCHVYVDDAWAARIGPPGADESDMLDFAGKRRAESRLSCQIRLRPETDGLVLHLPSR